MISLPNFGQALLICFLFCIGLSSFCNCCDRFIISNFQVRDVKLFSVGFCLLSNSKSKASFRDHVLASLLVWDPKFPEGR